MTASAKRPKAAPIKALPAPKRRALQSPSPRVTTEKPTRARARLPEDIKTSTLNIRVRADVKAKATAKLDEMGISLAEAVRVFLGRVASAQGLPFALEVPNADTAAALRESRASEPKTFASAEDLFDALEKASRG